MAEVGIYILIFTATLSGVELFRHWSLRRSLFDVPNERSSHTEPTPRGGGLIIVIVCLISFAVLTFFSNGRFNYGYLIGASLIALISWLDDLFSISFIWRFLVHSLAALIAIGSLGYFEEIYFPFYQTVSIGNAGFLLTFFWIVWLTNAYNFMDGIDGLAGIQAVTAGFGWLLVGKFFGAETVALYGGVVMFSSLGFLIKNWQPAKIFMGDVGSAFLGYTFAVMPLLMKNELNSAFEKRAILLPFAVLLVWLFVFDTLWTFVRRVLKKEKVWEAHREHLYQQMVIGGLSHQFVSGIYGVFSILTVLFVFLSLERKYFENYTLVFVGVQSIVLMLWRRFFRS
jgi:Fuc2NAc and GlcNAc transferase